jgi:hypothetical protein
MRPLLHCTKTKGQGRINEFGQAKGLGTLHLLTIPQLSHPPIYYFPTKEEGFFGLE